MSYITAAVLREYIETSVTDEALQVLIDAEEAALARRIGPLSGERTETFTPSRSDVLVLQRPTAAVEAEGDDGPVDVTLRADGRSVVADDAWDDTVSVTYQPNDAAEVWGVLIELMRLRLTETGYSTESTDSYSYTNDPTVRARRREGLIRSLLPKAGPNSVRILSSVTR